MKSFIALALIMFSYGALTCAPPGSAAKTNTADLSVTQANSETACNNFTNESFSFVTYEAVVFSVVSDSEIKTANADFILSPKKVFLSATESKYLKCWGRPPIITGYGFNTIDKSFSWRTTIKNPIPITSPGSYPWRMC